MLRKIFLLCALCLFVNVSYSQDLPSNYNYKQDVGEKTGIPVYQVIVDEDACVNSAVKGWSFEALSAIAQPERGKFGLMFLNAKKNYEFSTFKDKSCDLTIDGIKHRYPKYIYTDKSVVGQLKFETVTLAISAAVFKKIVKANDILIRCGRVRYQLDQDNIDAFQYLGSQIDKDFKARGKSY